MLQRLKKSFEVLLGRSKAIPLERNKRTNWRCPVCQQSNVTFNRLPSYFFKQWNNNQYIHSIFRTETFNIENYLCSHCSCSDRERLYALYFDKCVSKNDEKKYKVLDIAPDRSLSQYLKSSPNFIVRTADLYMEGVDDKVDITNMTIYADESFDIFICSHVLEHVEEDVKAMKELHRVLKKDGWGITMVPIDLGLEKDYENPDIKDEAGRWKHFGQNDHVRMYSKKGFITKLQSVGFTVHQYDVSFFGPDMFERNGIHPRSVLYIVTK